MRRNSFEVHHPSSPSRRQLLLGAASAGLLSACGGGTDDRHQVDPNLFTMRAETEPQAAMLLSSPTVDYKVGWSMREVQLGMVRELLRAQVVLYMVNDPAEADAFRADLAARGASAAELARFKPHTVPHGDLWVRDTGGLFLLNGKGQREVVDFDFNGYNYNPFAGAATRSVYDADNDMAVRVAGALSLPVRRSPLITEGGNLHFNGKGTVIAVEIATLGRNPGLSKAAVEAELHRVLGTRHVIWVPRSLASDAHTVLQTPYLIGGQPTYNVGVNHIDELVAWVDDRTLLLPEVTQTDLSAASANGDPTAAINRQILDQIHDILKRSTDQDGRPLQVIRVPEPGPIVVDIDANDLIWQFIADLDRHPTQRLQGAERFSAGLPTKLMLAASYMNYVVANEVVLIPKFFKPGRDPSLAEKDEKFRRLISEVYGGRRVVQLDVDALTVAGGGMHCITQQIPGSASA